MKWNLYCATGWVWSAFFLCTAVYHCTFTHCILAKESYLCADYAVYVGFWNRNEDKIRRHFWWQVLFCFSVFESMALLTCFSRAWMFTWYSLAVSGCSLHSFFSLLVFTGCSAWCLERIGSPVRYILSDIRCFTTHLVLHFLIMWFHYCITDLGSNGVRWTLFCGAMWVLSIDSKWVYCCCSICVVGCWSFRWPSVGRNRVLRSRLLVSGCEISCCSYWGSLCGGRCVLWYKIRCWFCCQFIINLVVKFCFAKDMKLL